MEKTQPQGAVEVRLPSTPATAAWPHIASYCSLHRYLPGVDVCERVAGDDGRPGCVRYVSSRAVKRPGEDADQEGRTTIRTWAREELLELDDAARRLSYAIVGSNMGFGRYVGTMEVLEESAGGCRLVWGIDCEPVPGWTMDGFLGFLETAFKIMAEKIEEAPTVNEG